MTFMSDPADQEDLGVAEAKARFSELIERVARGERIVVSRRGRERLVAPGGQGRWVEDDCRPLGTLV